MSEKKPAIFFNICGVFYLTLLLVGCNKAFPEVHLTEIPVTVGLPKSQEVDIDIVIQNVTPQVQEILPNAQLGGIVFSGHCEKLPQLQGKIVLSFVGTQFSIPFERIISATASVDTIQQTMNIHLRDVTDFYWSTDTLDIKNDNLSLDEIATKISEQIRASGLADCEVTITRLEDAWHVRCGPLENFIQECLFEIHPTTGKVTLLEQ